MAVVNDGGGQVQLQRTAPSVQRQQQVATTNEQVQHTQGQQQQQQQQQQQVVQGLVSMDEGEDRLFLLLIINILLHFVIGSCDCSPRENFQTMETFI